MKRTATTLSLLMLAGLLGAELPPSVAKKDRSPESLLAEIEALKAPKVAWRGIAWKTCLLEGLKESRARKKPVLLWAFIDRPIDDARC
jgi:hypothetical protein